MRDRGDERITFQMDLQRAIAELNAHKVDETKGFSRKSYGNHIHLTPMSVIFSSQAVVHFQRLLKMNYCPKIGNKVEI